MSKIKQGDRVRIKKPEDISDPIYWNTEGEMDYLDGRVVTVGPIDIHHVPTFDYENWVIALDWCEKIEDTSEEMTLAKWDKMSLQERLEWNRPAFESLVDGQGVEWYSGPSQGWLECESVCLETPCRPKQKIKSPPKEVWFGVEHDTGDIVTVAFYAEKEAEDWKANRVDEDCLRMVKYVIAE